MASDACGVLQNAQRPNGTATRRAVDWVKSRLQLGHVSPAERARRPSYQRNMPIAAQATARMSGTSARELPWNQRSSDLLPNTAAANNTIATMKRGLCDASNARRRALSSWRVGSGL